MYENNRRLPDISTITNIARYFNVSVDYLTYNSNIENTNIIFESDLFNIINNLSPHELEILKKFLEVLTNDKNNIS